MSARAFHEALTELKAVCPPELVAVVMRLQAAASDERAEMLRIADRMVLSLASYDPSLSDHYRAQLTRAREAS